MGLTRIEKIRGVWYQEKNIDDIIIFINLIKSNRHDVDLFIDENKIFSEDYDIEQILHDTNMIGNITYRHDIDKIINIYK